MKSALRHAFHAELAAARRALAAGRLAQAMRHAENAHVLGQRYVIPHTQSHWLMLRIGVRRRSLREVWGQALRIVLGILGSAVGIVPTGNTGGTDIGMFRRLPIEPALAKLLNEDRARAAR